MWHIASQFLSAPIVYQSLNATVAQSKNCPFGVNNTTELINIAATSHNTGTLSTPLDGIIFECSCYIFFSSFVVLIPNGIFLIVSQLLSVSDTGSSFYLITIVFPFLSVRLYTLSHRLAVTSLFGGCHNSVRLLLAMHNSRDALAMVAADVSCKFGWQFTNALEVFVQHVPF